MVEAQVVLQSPPAVLPVQLGVLSQHLVAPLTRDDQVDVCTTRTIAVAINRLNQSINQSTHSINQSSDALHRYAVHPPRGSLHAGMPLLLSLHNTTCGYPSRECKVS